MRSGFLGWFWLRSAPSVRRLNRRRDDRPSHALRALRALRRVVMAYRTRVFENSDGPGNASRCVAVLHQCVASAGPARVAQFTGNATRVTTSTVRISSGGWNPPAVKLYPMVGSTHPTSKWSPLEQYRGVLPAVESCPISGSFRVIGGTGSADRLSSPAPPESWLRALQSDQPARSFLSGRAIQSRQSDWLN
jgi:hypothetical protein